MTPFSLETCLRAVMSTIFTIFYYFDAYDSTEKVKKKKGQYTPVGYFGHDNPLPHRLLARLPSFP